MPGMLPLPAVGLAELAACHLTPAHPSAWRFAAAWAGPGRLRLLGPLMGASCAFLRPQHCRRRGNVQAQAWREQGVEALC